MLRAAGARPSGQVLRLRGLSALRPQEVPTSARTWLTSGARDLAKGQGKWYHEVLLRGRFREPQIGWLSARFQEGERDGNGVGDDADGWAFDGERCKQWHAGHTSEAGTVVEEECKGYASFSLRASARQPSLRGDPATSSAAAPDSNHQPVVVLMGSWPFGRVWGVFVLEIQQDPK